MSRADPKFFTKEVMDHYNSRFYQEIAYQDPAIISFSSEGTGLA